MRIKSILSVIAITLSLGGVVLAQPDGRGPGGPGGPRGGRMLEMVNNALEGANLSEEQRTNIDAILADAREEARMLMEDLQDADPQERRDTMREFMQSTRAKIEAELTEEQKATVAAKIEEMRQQRGPGGPGGPTTQPGLWRMERLADELDKLELSEEQRTAVTGAFDEMRAKMEEFRGKEEADRETRREQMRQLNEEFRTKLDSILTEDQRKQLRESMQPPGGEGGERRGRRGRDGGGEGNDAPPPAPEGEPKD